MRFPRWFSWVAAGSAGEGAPSRRRPPLAGAALLVAAVLGRAAAAPPVAEEGPLKQWFATAELARPRVGIRAADVAALRARVERDGNTAALAAVLVQRARDVLAKPPCERILKGRRLLGTSQQVLHRMTHLGFAWLLTQEDVFAQRAARELDAVCAFPDWNPSHFLDVGEMSLAVAIGYDWFHAVLPEVTRAAARQALLDKGLAPSFAGRPWWATAHNNWSQVCHGGMVAAALALADSDPDIAARTITRAVANVPRPMAEYAPDGAYPEGPGYWEYGTSFNAVLLQSLQSVFGDDFGLSRAPGFLASVDYMLHMTGPGGLLYGYADCPSAARRSSSTMLWMAAARGVALPATSPEARALRGEPAVLGNSRLTPLFVFRAVVPDRAAVPLPLDYRAAGRVPVAAHRSAWDDPRAWYVGIKGGSPSGPHGQMDAGSFMLEAKGQRWVHDLGSESYERIESRGMNLWSSAQGSDRWTVFRIGAEGHSVPRLGGAQPRVDGRATLSAGADDNPGAPVTLADLTSLYAGQAVRATRRFEFGSRRSLTVSDEFDGVAPGIPVTWQVLTQSAVTLSGDGRAATMSQGGEVLTVTLHAPADVRFAVVEANDRLHEWDGRLATTRILTFDAPAPAEGTLFLRVAFD